MKMTIEKINDELHYLTDESFKLQLSDGKDRQFGVAFRVLDMYDATGEDEFKKYPFAVEVDIVLDNPHKSFFEEDIKDPDKYMIIESCMSYMGGVPITHLLEQRVYTNDSKGFGGLCKNVDKDECKIKSRKDAQGEHKYIMFKTYEAAVKYLTNMVNDRCGVLSIMIGFILDKPVNLIGETGWSVIEHQVRGICS